MEKSVISLDFTVNILLIKYPCWVIMYIRVVLVGLSGLSKKQIKHEIGRWTFVCVCVGKLGGWESMVIFYCIHAYNFN